MTKTMPEYEIKAGLRIDTPDGKSGVISFVRKVYPGFFYIGVRDDDTQLLRTFYLVAADAAPAVLSEEAMGYGALFNDRLFFEEGIPGGGWEIVDFEIRRYQLQQGLPLERDNIYLRSRIYCELYPEYFGGLETPKNTPFGRIMRLKKAAEGLYFAETEKLCWILAVHYVIWQSDDLSDYTKMLGLVDAWDIGAPYMFFTLENSVPAIYELLALEQYRGLLGYIQSKEALAAELYRNHLVYVINHNLLELSGCGAADMASSLMAEFGLVGGDDADDEQALARRMANCIALLPSGQTLGKGLFLLP